MHTQRLSLPGGQFESPARSHCRTVVLKRGGRTSFGNTLMSEMKKIVAVIDDDPEIRAAMARLLLAFGYSAETFDSAETFLTRASTFRASCLLVDIQLGGLSGVELARQLAADGFKFPIIFMTGCDNATIKSQAIAAGGIAFLRKPFPPKMLIDSIKKAVAAD
jgi:FixJ family two-component response regulator